MSIELKNISKSYGPYQVLKNINLTIQSGELVTLLGPSGSGKTSLLRILAGLEFADEGTLLIHGKDLTDAPIKKRKAGFVFQHYALFNTMTIRENIAYGLRVRPRKFRPSKKTIQDRVNQLLHLIRLEPYSNRYPSQLSGGQRQRVALARALAIEPHILLLDEPFGALDAKVRKELRQWLRQLHQQVKMTSLLVTHDQEEAFEVSDRVVIINKGKVEQIGTPTEVYENPANAFVYDFIGNVNQVRGKINDGLFVNGNFRIPVDTLDRSDGIAYIRPDQFTIKAANNGPSDCTLSATVTHIHPVGSVIKLELERQDETQSIEVEVTKREFDELSLTKNQHVFLEPRQVKVFAAD
ncbi:sulfate/molybdate ABC transporter ATP-binding protein [Sporolactobacillus shoreicorticis]|uniref:Sulfate/molybdate ABC transporter ATP-binding protein n=1 Tax=Sporolactobacillus shoreicorticis TaxID=1923877 RepID=A0ABW5S4G9_9BACL|nr:sulfate/molybdate ABC transporter ATP-binding protein [Sporolactobacillus shoreicorticis]MCO7127679.1 sulfate/molybdate ABC transporter ATP-binding protein [Sporolactobacillus shoreicorticis]